MNERRETGDGPLTSGELLVRHEVDRDRAPTAAIVEAVAAATGVEPTALPPLGYAVDTDALNALLSDADRPLALSFAYAGVDVSVDRSGAILISKQNTDL